MFEDIKNHKAEVANQILKGFDSDIEKGVYVDNAENRKLGWVGRQYGGYKKQEDFAVE